MTLSARTCWPGALVLATVPLSRSAWKSEKAFDQYLGHATGHAPGSTRTHEPTNQHTDQEQSSKQASHASKSPPSHRPASLRLKVNTQNQPPTL